MLSCCAVPPATDLVHYIPPLEPVKVSTILSQIAKVRSDVKAVGGIISWYKTTHDVCEIWIVITLVGAS